MQIWHLFYKAQMLIWHIFYKTQILCWHYFTKPKSILATISKSPNSSLTKFYKDSKAQVLLWGPIDPICSNCIGKSWAQYPVSYVQTTLERAGPNTQSEDKRVSEDDQ